MLNILQGIPKRELKREPGENPGRSRRCKRGRNPKLTTWKVFLEHAGEGWGSRMIREPEDLP